MAKGKGGQIKGPRRQPSYFDNKRQQFGEDFLNKMNPDQLRKDMPRIVKDLAYKNIDIMNDYMIFMNANFLRQLEQYATEQLNANIAYEMAIEYYRRAIPNADPIYTSLLQKHTKLHCAYDRILYYIYAIRQSGNPNYLHPMMNDLFICRFLF